MNNYFKIDLEKEKSENVLFGKILDLEIDALNYELTNLSSENELYFKKQIRLRYLLLKRNAKLSTELVNVFENYLGFLKQAMLKESNLYKQSLLIMFVNKLTGELEGLALNKKRRLLIKRHLKENKQDYFAKKDLFYCEEFILNSNKKHIQASKILGRLKELLVIERQIARKLHQQYDFAKFNELELINKRIEIYKQVSLIKQLESDIRLLKIEMGLEEDNPNVYIKNKPEGDALMNNELNKLRPYLQLLIDKERYYKMFEPKNPSEIYEKEYNLFVLQKDIAAKKEFLYFFFNRLAF